MLRYIATYLLLFAAWLLWSGHTEPLLLGLGAASCALVLWLSIRMELIDEEGYPFQLALRLVAFIPWVLWQIVRSNLDITRIILSPKMPIRPHLVHIPVRQRTELGQVIHANTITITPGTVTLDVRNNTFLVHALTDSAADEDSSGELDRRCAVLEGQPLLPTPDSASPQASTSTEEE